MSEVSHYNQELPSPTNISTTTPKSTAPPSPIDDQDPGSPDQKTANYGTKTPSGNPRIYNCKQCNRAFTREEHLTRHTLSTHNKLKPFTCGICSRPFSRRDLLLRHAKNLHQGSELAVSRIRKSYKRNEINHYHHSSSTHDDDSSSSSSGGSPSSRRSIDNSDLTRTLLSPASSVSTTNNYSASSKILSHPVTSTPPGTSTNKEFEVSEKKRMKMSVNMLVS
ncbi:ADR1-like protein [Scheffersomyces xylosifermentans]|uniref:ADR1-like protein n=1 Tax=Scheffersomyces xylosifermentans TaxID=1304137 RepID=UPI00315CE46E